MSTSNMNPAATSFVPSSSRTVAPPAVRSRPVICGPRQRTRRSVVKIVGPAMGKAEALTPKTTPTPVPSEVEGFTVVTADDLLEAETVAAAAAEEDEEWENVIVNSETKSSEPVDRAAVLKSVQRQLAGHGHPDNDSWCLGGYRCEDCSTFLNGLQTLYNCWHEWTSTSRPFHEMPVWVLLRISCLSLAKQQAFNALLCRLAGADWAKVDGEYKISGDFEISAVLWALQIGPWGLFNGSAAGCEPLSILMDPEQHWVLSNNDEPDYKEKVKVLEGFAKSLCKWGCEFAEGA